MASVRSSRWFGLLAFSAAYAAPQAASPTRAPAIHEDARSLQAEPAYCQDIARDFCPKIPNLVKPSVRRKQVAQALNEGLNGARDLDVYKNLYGHLKTSLEKRGFPLQPGLDTKTLEQFIEPLAEDNVGKKVEIEQILKISEDCKSPKAVLKDIEKFASLSTPSNSSFEILTEASETEAPVWAKFRENLQNSVAARDLKAAADDYDSEDPKVMAKFGAAYSNFLGHYSAELAIQVQSTQKELTANKLKFQELTLLCRLLKNGEGAGSNEMDDCDAGFYLSTTALDGFTVAKLKSAPEFDRRVIDLKRKAWQAYQGFLANKNAGDSGPMIEMFRSWKREKILNESDFAAVVAKSAQASPNSEDVDAQISPYFEQDVGEAQGASLCARRKDLMLRGLNQEHQRVERLVARSEPVVKFIQAKLYPESSRPGLDALVKKSVTRSSQLYGTLASYIEDVGLQKRIGWAIGHAKAYHPENQTDAYSIDPSTGISSLDFSNISGYDYFYHTFAGAGGFKELLKMNASVADTIMAQVAVDNEITLSPLLYESYQSTPAALQFLLSHELGHMIDPRTFKLSGNKFPEAFNAVVECMAKKESASALPHQRGECFSDWFAAEAIAADLKEMSDNDRYGYAQGALRFLCEQDLESEGVGSAGSDEKFWTDEHPTPRKRINGILGAHPTIREAIGCRLPSSYPYCGMSGGDAR